MRSRSRLSKTLLERHGSPVYVVPCTITQVTPLLISMAGGDNLPATKMLGLTYTLNAAALAYCTESGIPQVAPIG